jgi:hypothetical protein
VSKLHIVAEHVDVQQLPDILLAIVGCSRHRSLLSAKTQLPLMAISAMSELPASPVNAFFSSPNLPLILASSLSTRRVSCSLF